MSRNNTIGITGVVETPPRLVVDAADWKKKVYETTLVRKRPSETEDTYILQFDGRAAGTEEMIQRITEGTKVLVGGEIRTENLHNPLPEENSVKIYIYAEIISVNDPPADDQNEVKICGHICKPPLSRKRSRQKSTSKKIDITNVLIAVKTPTGTSYVPCVCFDKQALVAKEMKTGDYIEVYGRFHARGYKKRIKGHDVPFLRTTYEVYAIEIENSSREQKKTKQNKEGSTDV